MKLFDPDQDLPLTQYAALCWRRARGRVEVLLITSRETERWVIPKGWPMAGLTAAECAAREAWEEAGVRGDVADGCIGVFSYDKVLDHARPERPSVPCMVAVYPLRVRRLAKVFPEVEERRLKWLPPDRAARKVTEPELQALIAAFAPERSLPMMTVASVPAAGA